MIPETDLLNVHVLCCKSFMGNFFFPEPKPDLLLGIGIPFTIGTIKNGGTYKVEISCL